MPNPQATFKMSPQLLVDLLKMPEGATIESVGWDHERQLIVVSVASSDLPTLHPGDDLIQCDPRFKTSEKMRRDFEWDGWGIK